MRVENTRAWWKCQSTRYRQRSLKCISAVDHCLNQIPITLVRIDHLFSFLLGTCFGFRGRRTCSPTRTPPPPRFPILSLRGYTNDVEICADGHDLGVHLKTHTEMEFRGMIIGRVFQVSCTRRLQIRQWPPWRAGWRINTTRWQRRPGLKLKKSDALPHKLYIAKQLAHCEGSLYPRRYVLLILNLQAVILG